MLYFCDWLVVWVVVMVEQTSVVWQACLADLHYEVGEVEFNQWILPLRAYEETSVLRLEAINNFFIKHIKKKYLNTITDLVLKHSDGRLTAVDLIVIQVATPTVEKAVKKSKPITSLAESDGVNILYTFDAFVRGKSNLLAYNACYDMAKKAEQGSYASLFLYGVSGVGKTHLMQSVAHRYQKNGKKFCYFGSDGFMQKVGRAFLENNMPAFIKNVSQADLLIIDDVHLIPSKKKPQMANVLLGLYSDFTQNGKRVILASDKPPAQMEDFDSRFLSRFSEGLTVAIDPPEMDTRVHILEKKAASLGLNLPKECAIFIAQNVAPDVRRLEGALNQVHANASMMDVAVDIALVRQAIKTHIVARAQSINSDTIKSMVAEYFGVSIKDLIGKKRVRHIARPRQIAMSLTREFTGDSFPDIGQAFGGRDHTTVMHACEKVAELRESDLNFEKDYRALATMLELS